MPESTRKASPSADTRDAYVRTGDAMAGGRYPIRTQAQLNNACQDWVRTGRPSAVEAWIRHQARKHSLSLPDWFPGGVAKDAGPDSSDVHVNVPLGSDAPRRRRKGDVPEADDEEIVEETFKRRGPILIEGVVPFRKRTSPQRFTFSPVYIPNRYDAHDEWMTPDELQKAVWDLSEHGDRELNLQHIGGTVSGRWVELACIPWEHEVELMVPGHGVRKAVLPANTPWMGVLWEPWAFDAVEKGLLRGLSIEGTSQRTIADIALPG